MYIIAIPKTLRLIAYCWNVAEAELRDYIEKNCINKGEEFITESFHAHFAEVLRDASNKNSIARAFLEDLRDGLPKVQDLDLQRIAKGIIAEATLHNKATEGKTGGDLGLVLLRPAITYEFSSVRIGDYRRGLLCQAKIRKRDGKWRSFTKPQREKFSVRASYLALLLYQYTDVERRTLDEFVWQLCTGFSLEEVEAYLRENAFPNRVGAARIIADLGRGYIGTENKKIINEIISPVKNASLTIRIWWPDPKNPPGTLIRVMEKQSIKSQARIMIRH
jgi:hypothetical protein